MGLNKSKVACALGVCNWKIRTVEKKQGKIQLMKAQTQLLDSPNPVHN